MNDIMTLEEAKEITRLTDGGLRRVANEGIIPALPISGVLRFFRPYVIASMWPDHHHECFEDNFKTDELQDLPRLLRTSEIADYLRVQPPTIHRLIRSGEMRHNGFSHTMFYIPSFELISFVTRNKPRCFNNINARMAP